jgi:hypothetical protein
MRTIMTLAGALLALAIHAVAARGQCSPSAVAHSYQIECKFTEIAADGTLRLRASPTVITQDGQQAQIRMGGEQAVGGAREGSVEFVPFGVHLRVKLQDLKDDSLRADMAWERAKVEEDTKDVVQIHTRSCRTIQTLKLGERIELGEKVEEGKPAFRVELVVRRLSPGQLIGAGVNSDAGLTGSIKCGECTAVAPSLAAAALCLPPGALDPCPEAELLPPPAPLVLGTMPLPAPAPCCQPDPIVGISAAVAGFVSPPPATGPCPCPAPCCPTALPAAPEPAALAVVPGNSPSVEEIIEHIRQLHKDRIMLAAQKEMLEHEEKAALALVQKRLEAQGHELKTLASDSFHDTAVSSSTKATSISAGWKNLDQKLDGILDRLNQLEERLNEVDRNKGDAQKSSSIRIQPTARVSAVLPFFGPIPIAVDFGFPLGLDASRRCQDCSFWTGFSR